MKTIPPPCPEPEVGPKYWRSLEEQAESPAFRTWLEREFPAGASELTDPVTRRNFVKLMSASFLLAGFGLTGCRRPEEKILPFSRLPEGYVHGMPRYYATSMPTRGSAIPLVVKSYEGRPTKIEGNSEHPINQVPGQDANNLVAKRGATDLYAQASILNLYDVDRAMHFSKGGSSAKREAVNEALAGISSKAQANGGQGLAFLLERNNSPSRARLQKQIATKFPNAKWYLHEAVDFDIHRQAATLAFGQPVAPRYQLKNAKVILSLDCDFIGGEEDAYLNIRDFAQSRRLTKSTDSMSRLYCIESLFTLAGMNADHRLRVPSGAVLALAAKLGAGVLGGNSATSGLASALQTLGRGAAANEKWLAECAKDLAAHPGEVVVLAGHRQPLAVHLIAHAMNVALGAVGKTVVYLPAADLGEGSIADLAQALNGGSVDTLVILGGNPVYNAPADLNWAATQRKAKTVVRLGYYEDESAQGVDWHLPLAHFLESWGDARTADGTLVPVQPLIEPLFGGITELEVLARIGGLPKTSAYEIVRETFKDFGGDVEDNWEKFLHDGYLANSAASPVAVTFNGGAAAGAISAAKASPVASTSSLEVVFHRDYSVDDGRYNNNGWLQELPDPIHKITWENVILLSPKTAKDLGLTIVDKEDNRLESPVVRVEVNGRSIEGPAWAQPGMADNVVGVALGYGRTKPGRIGKGTGFNAYAARTTTALHIASGAKLSATGRMHPLATTQNHWAMEGRPIVREANLEQYKKFPKFAKGMNMHE
ncbi:MAG TPA: TAT-variant-translocated molybdopterin oxidoreductase, partial [Verrucomicrobiae bacterium]|nr:TAT-variant-translocated molybdopterin oxidoreductase [Verrucomicrobiae bacterium]